MGKITLDLGDWYTLAIVYPFELCECYERDWDDDDIIIKRCRLIEEFGEEPVRKLIDFYTFPRTGHLIFFFIAQDIDGNKLKVTRIVAAIEEVMYRRGSPLVKIEFVDVDEWLRSRNDP